MPLLITSRKREYTTKNTIREEQIAERDKTLESFRAADEKIEADNRKSMEDSISEFAERKKAIKEKEIHDIAKELVKVVGRNKK